MNLNTRLVLNKLADFLLVQENVANLRILAASGLLLVAHLLQLVVGRDNVISQAEASLGITLLQGLLLSLKLLATLFLVTIAAILVARRLTASPLTRKLADISPGPIWINGIVAGMLVGTVTLLVTGWAEIGSTVARPLASFLFELQRLLVEETAYPLVFPDVFYLWFFRLLPTAGYTLTMLVLVGVVLTRVESSGGQQKSVTVDMDGSLAAAIAGGFIAGFSASVLISVAQFLLLWLTFLSLLAVALIVVWRKHGQVFTRLLTATFGFVLEAIIVLGLLSGASASFLIQEALGLDGFFGYLLSLFLGLLAAVLTLAVFVGILSLLWDIRNSLRRIDRWQRGEQIETTTGSLPANRGIERKAIPRS